jgi:iron complex outermembrane receptor protein
LRPAGFDANLKWETTASYNVGLDFGFKNDRFSGSIDVYRKETSDLLATVPVPAGTNFTNMILTNVGGMRNQGVEASLNVGIIAKKNARLDWAINATYNQNKVTKLSLVSDPKSPGVLVGGIGGGIGNTIQVHQVDYATFTYFVLEQQYDTDGSMIQVGEQASIDIIRQMERYQCLQRCKWRRNHQYRRSLLRWTSSSESISWICVELYVQKMVRWILDEK